MTTCRVLIGYSNFWSEPNERKPRHRSEGYILQSWMPHKRGRTYILCRTILCKTALRSRKRNMTKLRHLETDKLPFCLRQARILNNGYRRWRLIDPTGLCFTHASSGQRISTNIIYKQRDSFMTKKSNNIQGDMKTWILYIITWISVKLKNRNYDWEIYTNGAQRH